MNVFVLSARDDDSLSVSWCPCCHFCECSPQLGGAGSRLPSCQHFQTSLYDTPRTAVSLLLWRARHTIRPSLSDRSKRLNLLPLIFTTRIIILVQKSCLPCAVCAFVDKQDASKGCFVRNFEQIERILMYPSYRVLLHYGLFIAQMDFNFLVLFVPFKRWCRI